MRTQPDTLATASAIADLLADPQARLSPRGAGRRRPQSLAGGAAGVALLHIERALSGHGDWDLAHAWLRTATRDELSAGPNASLFFGTPTLAFVTHAAAEESGRYRRALATLDAATIKLTRRRLNAAHARIDRGERPALAEFDLIRGLAGLGRYHLRRHPDHEITRAVLAYLVRLTQPLPDHGNGLPGWWTEVSPHGEVSPEFPGGHANQGMSHGIAAILAMLSLAVLRGVSVVGHTDAIGRICAFLDTWQQPHPAGPWWPGIITLNQVHTAHIQTPGRQRPSWCYATPGVARAQQLAGLATGDVARQRTAVAAMLGCLRDSDQLDRITDVGLCHGTAGVLQTACRIAADAGTPDLAAELPALCTRLLDQLDAAPELFEFLDGLTGVALALHTAATGTAPRSGWDACLMLA